MVPTTPETCGHAMEVPEITLKSEGSLPSGVSAESLPIHAARMFTPGAAISGCEFWFSLCSISRSKQYKRGRILKWPYLENVWGNV